MPNLRRLSMLLLLTPIAASADIDAMRQCRKLPDAASRLACYDRIPLPENTAAPRAAAPAAPNAPPQAATAKAAPSAAPAADATRFGLENRTTATPQLDAIRSHIPGHFDGWEGNARIRLANGQVWQVIDGSTAAYDLRDPAVEITRGALGSFFRKIAGVSQSPRVRRVE